jgi:hypothetical protein
MKRLALALLLAAGFGVGVPASASAQAFLETRISVSFSSTSPATLFGVVAQMTMGRIGLAVDPSLQRPTTITLEDVKVRTFLDASCDSIGCRWRIEGNRLIVEALPPDPSRGRTWIQPKGTGMPTGSQFAHTTVATILDVIGRVIGEGRSYEVDAVSPNQQVTVDISNQDALRAIATVVRAAGLRPGSEYTITVRRAGEKPTIIKTVLPKEPEPEETT